MKLLVLTAACIISGLCFSQQLKPEIKELMKQTELNPPNGLIYSENNRMQKLHPPMLYKKPDAIPDVRMGMLDQRFMFRQFSKNLGIELMKGRIDPDKPGIYLLAPDNMPCIVPDTKDISRIPNMWKGKVEVPYRSKIPNPASPKVFTLPKALVSPKDDTK